MKRYQILLIAIAALFVTGCSGDAKKDIPDGTEEAKLEYKVEDYVKLGEYKDLEINYVVPQVTSEDMEMQIQELVDENVEYTEITDRPAQEGDSVNIDYIGTVDGAEFEGGSDTNFDLVLGSGEFLEEFEKNLIGASLGATVTFSLVFPEDYAEELASKQAEFTVTVNSIDEVKTPEYTDELVKSTTEYSTMEEYEEAMQGELMETATQESISMAGEEALSLAIKNAKLDGYPSELYDVCYQDTVSSYQSYADMFEMELKDFLEQYMDMDEEGIKEAAISWVNDILVTEAIAKKEGFSVSEKEYKEAVGAMVEEYGYDSLTEFEKDNSRISIESSLIRDKVLTFLYDNSKLKEMSEDEYYEQVSTE